jgi:hypothetical protein
MTKELKMEKAKSECTDSTIQIFTIVYQITDLLGQWKPLKCKFKFQIWKKQQELLQIKSNCTRDARG